MSPLSLQRLSRVSQQLLFALTFVTVLLSAAPPASRSEKALADSFQKKIEHIQNNAKEQPPSSNPTVLKEDEVNAYFAQRRLKIPDGVRTVRFELRQDE